MAEYQLIGDGGKIKIELLWNFYLYYKEKLAYFGQYIFHKKIISAVKTTTFRAVLPSSPFEKYRRLLAEPIG